MSRSLAACLGCLRHIATDEPACPFCGRAHRPGELVARRRLDSGLSRHARHLATLLFGGAVASCATTSTPTEPGAAGPSAATDGKPAAAPSSAASQSPAPPSASTTPPPARPEEEAPRRVPIYGDTRIMITQTVHFSAGSATPSKSDDALLDAIPEILQRWPDLHLTIEGHASAHECDPKAVGSTATAKLCDRLAKQRAEAVLAALVKRKADPARLKVASSGATKPIADDATSEGRPKNRRVELGVHDKDGGSFNPDR